MPPRILLINPWICDFAAYDLWAKPVGLLRIASALRQPGNEIYFINCLERAETKADATGSFIKQRIEKPPIIHNIPRRYFRYGISEDDFMRQLAKTPAPDLILVTSMMTYWYLGVVETIRAVKKIFPKTKIILGGIYAALCPEHAEKFCGADMVYRGRSLPEIVNIVYQALNISPLPDVDKPVPYPAYELLTDQQSLPLQTSSGCVFHCSYCAAPRLYPEFYQLRAEEAAEEIIFYHHKFNTRHFAFYDDALLVNADQHIKVILDKIITAGIKCFFHTPNGLHGRFIDRELARLFKKANFATVRLSLESRDAEFQAKSGNKVNTEDIVRAVGFLKQAGFSKKEIGIYTLLGYPGQEKAGLLRDIEFVQALGAARLYLANYALIPGTRDYESLRQQGRVSADTDPLLHGHSIAPVLWGKFSFDEIRVIRKKVAAYNAN